MNLIQIIGGIMLIIAGIILIVIIMMQNNNTEGFDVISGGTYGASNSGKSRDERLAKITKIVGIVFFALSLVVWLIGLFA